MPAEVIEAYDVLLARDGCAKDQAEALVGGCRSIYDAASMDDPVARRVIQECAEAGEQGRLLARVPMKMKLADQTTALLPLTPAGTAGALVIRAPMIICALREYFEMLWERATPLRPQRPVTSAGRLTPAQQAVLEMMAEGLGDDAIARRAGLRLMHPSPMAETSSRSLPGDHFCRAVA